MSGFYFKNHFRKRLRAVDFQRKKSSNILFFRFFSDISCKGSPWSSTQANNQIKMRKHVSSKILKFQKRKVCHVVGYFLILRLNQLRKQHRIIGINGIKKEQEKVWLCFELVGKRSDTTDKMEYTHRSYTKSRIEPFYDLRLYFSLIKCFTRIHLQNSTRSGSSSIFMCFHEAKYTAITVNCTAFNPRARRPPFRQYAILSTYNFTSCRKLLWCRWRKRTREKEASLKKCG